MDIKGIMLEQLARDYACSIVDITSRRNVFVEARKLSNSRYFAEDTSFLRVLCINSKLVFFADPVLYSWVRERFDGFPGQWFFNIQTLKEVDNILNRYGYQIHPFSHHNYIPGDHFASSDNTEEPVDFRIKWVEKADIPGLREENRFWNSFCFNSDVPDMLGAIAEKDGTYIGAAGVRASSENLWEMGVDVLETAQGKGVATTLVRVLKDELLQRGKVPYYGTAESHIKSQKVAVKAGFVPAWAEVYTRKI
ncbi:MAG TPA: GNAT family N-acetyltransferase [Mobilitalea sp.]|nr:GNAT family N-acetyltransferase [Mobilitalea sp.]